MSKQDMPGFAAVTAKRHSVKTGLLLKISPEITKSAYGVNRTLYRLGIFDETRDEAIRAGYRVVRIVGLRKYFIDFNKDSV